MAAAQKFYKYDTSYVWVMALAAAVYSMAAYFAYLKRGSERAGTSIVFPGHQTEHKYHNLSRHILARQRSILYIPH